MPIGNLWPVLYHRTKVEVGDGSKTSFWDDKWNGSVPMKQLHPELFTLCQHQQATVATMKADKDGICFLRRNLQDWEIDKVAEFQDSVGSFSNVTETEDLLVWQNDTKCQFSVNSVYKELNKNGQEMEWPWKII